MTRRTWRKGDLRITYSDPMITSFAEIEGEDRPVESMDNVLYFYYDIKILNKGKTIFETRTHDFPKVQDLPYVIDHLLHADMTKAYVVSEIEEEDFYRKVSRIEEELDDTFNMEYFYKLERVDYAVRQHDETEQKHHSDYTLTIGQTERNQSFGPAIVIKDLSKADLLRLKKTALSFCEEAIREHNRTKEEEGSGNE